LKDWDRRIGAGDKVDLKGFGWPRIYHLFMGSVFILSLLGFFHPIERLHQKELRSVNIIHRHRSRTQSSASMRQSLPSRRKKTAVRSYL
jgi:hypothetical protein